MVADQNQDHIMGERENHIATCISLSPGEGLLPPHRGKQRCRWRWLRRSIPPPAGCRNRINLTPKNIGDGGGALLRIWENPSGVRVFSTGMIYRPKGVARGRDDPRPRATCHPRMGPAGALLDLSWMCSSGSGPYLFNKKSS